MTQQSLGTQRALIAPSTDVDSQWWWQLLREGSFMLPRCQSCGRFWFPPMPACPHCGSDAADRVAACGLGRVYSWVVVHIALHPLFEAETPYTVLTVELDEGPRIFGRLLGSSAPTPSARVRALRYELDGVALLGFETTSTEEMGDVTSEH